MRVGIPGVDAYPLYWPEGWPRTKDWARGKAPYKLEFLRARDELVREIRLLGAREVVLSTNVPLRRDGLPLAGQSEPKDPGVAVYWTKEKWVDGKPVITSHVMACDRWRSVRENVRAVGLAIEGLRAIQRSGATQILDRAFMGFAALPASTTVRTWRDVLNLPAEFSRELLDAHYRELAKKAHPDVAGGSHEAMTALNVAYREAQKHLEASR